MADLGIVMMAVTAQLGGTKEQSMVSRLGCLMARRKPGPNLG